MSEKQRPPWLKVVGGTDHTPSSERIERKESEEIRETGEEVSQPNDSEKKKIVELLRVYLDVISHYPADFKISLRPERVREAALQVESWTAEQLCDYLSRPDIWQRPSFTKAVIDEVPRKLGR